MVASAFSMGNTRPFIIWLKIEFIVLIKLKLIVHNLGKCTYPLSCQAIDKIDTTLISISKNKATTRKRLDFLHIKNGNS